MVDFVYQQWFLSLMFWCVPVSPEWSYIITLRCLWLQFSFLLQCKTVFLRKYFFVSVSAGRLDVCVMFWCCFRETHLWYVKPSQVKGESLLKQYLDILSPCEKENVSQMHGEELKKSALLARALVRTTIARCMSSFLILL